MTSVGRRDLANDGGRAFGNLLGDGRSHQPDRLGNARHGYLVMGTKSFPVTTLSTKDGSSTQD
jgi:hypothetical protein